MRVRVACACVCVVRGACARVCVCASRFYISPCPTRASSAYLFLRIYNVKLTLSLSVPTHQYTSRGYSNLRTEFASSIATKEITAAYGSRYRARKKSRESLFFFPFLFIPPFFTEEKNELVLVHNHS